MLRRFATFVLVVSCLAGAPGDAATPVGEVRTFTNPLLPSGPDPWVIRDGADYYYMHTLVDRLAVWKTRDLSRLKDATRKTIWKPPARGANSGSIWAPELHRFDGTWYVYYSAVDRDHDDDAHRGIFVLENSSADPMAGQWRDRGRVNTRYPGIDGTVFQVGATRYFAYSAFVPPDSVLVIARMKDATTLAGEEVILARPEFDWELHGGKQILEGPEFLAGPKGDLFIFYSASGCWTDDYSLGMLRAAPGSDPLDIAAWHKSPTPVLQQSPRNRVFGPGHNGFFTSPDGRENWIIYHANPRPGMGCEQRRSPRMQRFAFDADGVPVFDEPVSSSQRLSPPAPTPVP